MRKGYITYLKDTIRVGDKDGTLRTMHGMTWYARAKKRMKEKGVTQEDLIALFGVATRGAVGHYLNGRREPSPLSLPKLADRLEMSLDELLRGPPPISKRKQALDDNYAAADEEGKREIEKIGSAVAKPTKLKIRAA